MGKMQREKGKAYERAVAAEFRKRWTTAIVRRASQAERADNPDVFIEGGPPILARLWLELQDARVPVPLSKLGQAERDSESWLVRRGFNNPHRLPIAIWHRLGERTSYATTRLWVLDEIRGKTVWMDSDDVVVTMRLDEFLEALEMCHPNRCTCAYEVGSGGPTCTCWFGKQRAA